MRKFQLRRNNYYKANTGSAGFTLVEIILSVAVLAIITGSSYVALIQFSRSQSLNSEYLKLKNILNLAKSNASSQVFNCEEDQTLVGQKVAYDSSKSYKTYEVCRSLAGDLIDRSTRSTSISTGMSISNFQPILFLVISGQVKTLSSQGVLQDIPTTGVEIILTEDNGGRETTVTVFPNGRIE